MHTTTRGALLRTLSIAFALPLLSQVALAESKWDLPTAYAPSSFQTENLQSFVNDVDKASAGKLKITLHTNASLYKANEIKRAVQGGQAQIGEIIISGMANEDPIYALDNVPFLATSYADAKKLWVASKSAVEAKLAKNGIKLLYSVPWPPQGLYSKTEVSSMDALKRLKIRSYSPTVARMIELMGAQPVTVQAADLTQALSTGVVSANVTSGATGYDTKSWEQLKYFYDVQAWLPKNIVIVSQKAFDALDPATQKAVTTAAAAAETRGWKISEEKTAWYLEELKKNGMTVAPASAELKAGLVKVGEKMAAEWAESAGPEGKKLLEAYRK